jgi:HemY protein
MWRFIWLLIILIASVWLGLQIAKDPGLAFFSYKQWSVEMPLWFATVIFIATLFILYFLITFFDNVSRLVYRFKSWLHWRRKHNAYSKTNRGLMELIEGRFKNAEHDLLEGLSQSDATLVNYLALAKAAHEQAAYDRRDTYLRKAHAAAPDADVVIGLTSAQLQMSQGQLEQALATLKHLKSLAPKHVLVLKLLERVYVHLGDWHALLALLPKLYKAGVVNREQLTMLEKKVYEEILKSFNSREAGLSDLHDLWETVPRKLQKEPGVIYCYAKQLLNYPDDGHEIEYLIYKVLKKTWDMPLAKLYGIVKTTDPKKQLSHAETLLKQYPNEAVLLLSLGRICVRSQLWGKARSYFQESLNLEAHADTFAEYGKLLEHLGDSTAAMESYRDGLDLTRSYSP